MIRHRADSSQTNDKRVDGERLELLARIAGMYYEERLTQEEIAAQTGYSRSMVSRFLTEARDQNVVEIRVNHPLDRRRELEHALQTRLGLKSVRVLARGTLSYTQMLRRLGALAARWLEELLHDNISLGISWGISLYEMVNALRPLNAAGLQVTQLLGSLGTPEPDIDGPELARRLARNFSGRYVTLPAPLYVDSEATRDALLSDAKVRRVTASYAELQLALLGIGSVDNERSTLLRAGYVTEDQLDELRKAGAVGDVCALHIDVNGNLVDAPLTRRAIGIRAQQLAAVPLKLAIAGGQSKGPAIIGACRAGFVNLLVTDEVAANQVLQLIP